MNSADSAPSDLFKGTAHYYARYRPGYPAEFFAQVGRAFGLDGRGRLLDLGCGTGQIAIPLAGRFAEVIAMDPEPEMLAEAEAAIVGAGAGNVTLVRGSSADLQPMRDRLGSFRVVTMGSSFHWMDRPATLQTLATMVDRGGGIVIASSGSLWNAPTAWGQAVKTVVQRWLGAERRAGGGTYNVTPERHEAIIDRSPFGPCRASTLTYPLTWTVDSVIGYLYSTSFCAPGLLGDRREAFAADVRRTLLAIDPAGRYVEDVRLEILLGYLRE